MFLMGLIVSLAVLSVRSESPVERLEREAGRLHARMDLAREEAVLRSRSLGLRVTPGGYRFLQRDDGDWRIPAGDRLLSRHELPESMRLEADLDGLEVSLTGAGDVERRPHIFFLASGEIIPDFTLRLSARDSEFVFTIAPGEEQWLELSENGR